VYHGREWRPIGVIEFASDSISICCGRDCCNRYLKCIAFPEAYRSAPCFPRFVAHAIEWSHNGVTIVSQIVVVKGDSVY